MSARREGTVIARGPNRWLLRWELGRDPQTGKRHRKNETFHGTKKEADRRWRDIQSEIEKGTGLRAEGLTFAALWEQWLAVKAQDRRPSTISNYRIYGSTYILPQLGRHEVAKLTVLDVQDALNAWRKTPLKRDPSRVLSPRSVAYCRALVVSCLDQAAKWQLVRTNVAAAVRPPKQVRTPRKWWTPTEAQRFLEIAAGDPLELVFRLALSVGLRRGEILGLRWEDIDMDNRALTVAQTMTLVDGKIGFGPPKTPESHRTLALDADILRALRQHRTVQKRQRLLAGTDYEDHGLVVQTALGKPLSPRNLGRTFTRLQTRAGLTPIRFHDLRHTHASWLLQQGVDPRTIADRMGHSEVSFTMQIYTHSTLEAQREASEKIAALLWPHGLPPQA